MAGPSFFSYPISRQYPTRLYSYIIIGGGIIITIFFTFIAVAANAYEAHTVTVTDFRAAEHDKKWFQKAPFSWAGSTTNRCNPALLTAQGSYTTTNHGLTHTLAKMQQVTSNGTIIGDPMSTQEYKDAVLQNCSVSEILIDLPASVNVRLARNFWTWHPSSTATTVCHIQTEKSEKSPAEIIELTFKTYAATHKFNEAPPGSFATFPRPTNYTYYVARMAWSWQSTLSWALSYSVPDGKLTTDGANWGNSAVSLSRNSNTTDYTSLDFFKASMIFPSSDSGLQWLPANSTIKSWKANNAPNNVGGYPNISLSIDAFGKSFYSLLLTDFGVYDATNALTSEKGVRYLQSINDTDLYRAVTIVEPASSDKRGLSMIWKELGDDIHLEPFNKSSSTSILTQYQCSVPRQKSGGSLFFAVFIADIVFLTSIWGVFQWFTTTFVLPKSDPRSNFCEKCAHDSQDVPLMNRSELGMSRGGMDKPKTSRASSYQDSILFGNSSGSPLQPGLERAQFQQPLLAPDDRPFQYQAERRPYRLSDF